MVVDIEVNIAVLGFRLLYFIRIAHDLEILFLLLYFGSVGMGKAAFAAPPSSFLGTAISLTK